MVERRQASTAVAAADGAATRGGGLPLGQAGAGTLVPPPARADVPAPLPAWLAAAEALDAARLAESHTVDAAYDNAAGATVLRGQAAIRGFLAADLAAFSGAWAHYTNVSASGDHATGEWTFAGRSMGQVPGFPAGAGRRSRTAGSRCSRWAAG